jgi:hypothetical protein
MRHPPPERFQEKLQTFPVRKRDKIKTQLIAGPLSGLGLAWR